ncbi:hypothetical protein TraAM80_08799 [Trypanosoma rangeli]|uniref:Potassium channel tetramerisation-type BTB domain-containing protein n=1 Tax=Trypanosoma rangeli TaxID=5698 RepID=A0A422MYU2_TRYRA|nr:uncharacterized protein TraAM80_08799 [Trypanosoma rangeli]RNE98396.1 hypothetical protein TraAM80_08799 [Trypanosoma rangeli]|eukprot:RNE98396.1 hypothetical protein TraAM80_08799 [Trypanosoma rangeli]
MNSQLQEVEGDGGLPLVMEYSQQLETQEYAFPTVQDMSITGENGEAVHGDCDNNDTDNVDVMIRTLLNQYSHLKRSALAYMRTSLATSVRLQLKRQRIEQHESSLRRRAELFATASLSPIIKLNIGGTRFHVQRDTLLQFTMTVFHLLEDGRFMVQKDEFGCVFVDRDPWLFRELLFLLRERRQRILEAGVASAAPSPGGVGYRRLLQLSPVERKRLLDEARYYGLNELLREITTKRFQWQQCKLTSVNFTEYETNGSEHNEDLSSKPPEGRCFATCVCWEDDIFLFGGCGENEEVFDSFFLLYLEFDDNDDDGGDEETVVDGAKAPPERLVRLKYNVIQSLSSGEEDHFPVPEPRSGHAMVLLQGRYMLLFYGNNLHSHLNDVWLYHLTRGMWVRVAVRGALVEARSGHTVTEVNGRLFLIGGKRLFGENRHLFAEVFEGHFDVDRVELTWSIVASPQTSLSFLNQQREGMQPLVDEGLTASAAATVDAVEDNEGEALCSLFPMAYHTAVEYKGRYIIVYGGMRASSGTQIGGGSGGGGRWNSMAAATVSSLGGASPSVYQFDTLESTWRRLRTSTDSPNVALLDIPRSGHIALRYNDDMYVMGSYKEQRSLSVFSLSLKTLMWRQVQTAAAPMHSLPCGRAMPTGTLLPPTASNPYPMIFLYGGYDAMNRKYLNDAYLLTL